MSSISHITFVCKNIEKSAQLFTSLLDAKEVYSSDGKNFSHSREKFLLIGNLWLALMEGDPVSRSYNHIAFRIEESEIPEYMAKLKSLGLEIVPGRPRNSLEGRSIYFYDYDNHLFELHTGDLETRLEYYRNP